MSGTDGGAAEEAGFTPPWPAGAGNAMEFYGGLSEEKKPLRLRITPHREGLSFRCEHGDRWTAISTDFFQEAQLLAFLLDRHMRRALTARAQPAGGGE